MNNDISNTQNLFNKLLKRIPRKAKRFNRISMLIAAAINTAIRENGKSQKWLSDQLDRNESQISKWLSGNHNFTIKTIIEIESALNTEILTINYRNPKTIQNITSPYLLYSKSPNTSVTVVTSCDYTDDRASANQKVGMQ